MSGLQHIDLVTEIRLRVTVHAAVVLASKGGTHYLDIGSIRTSEGLDLHGLLPSEVMYGLQDEAVAQAEINDRALEAK